MTCKDQYDLSLIPLTEDKLELVRNWRNSEPVRKYMEFQQYITPEMQQEWFGSMNRETTFYSIIVCNGIPIGISHIKNIDRKAKSGEAGIFIADQHYLDSAIPVLSSLQGLDCCFHQLGLETIYCKTADDNVKATRLNIALGYEPVEHEESGSRFRYYKLTKKSYYQHREHLIDLLYGTE